MERNAVSSSNKKIMNEMKNEVGLRRRKEEGQQQQIIN